MQLNLSTDIALRTLIYLGQKSEPATITEVSNAFDIAKTHLMKVVMTLVAHWLSASAAETAVSASPETQRESASET